MQKKPLKITESDSGKVIELKIGRCFNVILEGNPTTGYTWDAASTISTILKQIKEPEYRSKYKLIGSGGEFTFHYKAANSGSTELKFVYHRSWERKAPIKIFTINISVK